CVRTSAASRHTTRPQSGGGDETGSQDGGGDWMNLSDVGPLTFEHLYLVIIGTIIGGGIGFLLAIWVRRRPNWAALFIGLVEVIHTNVRSRRHYCSARC